MCFKQPFYQMSYIFISALWFFTGPFAPRSLNTHHFKCSKGTHIPHPLLQVMSSWELFLEFSTQKPHHSLLDAVWRSSSSEAITVSTGHPGMRVLEVKKQK